MCYLYILLCDEEFYYVGITNNLKNRFRQHWNKESLYTKRFSKVRLVYWESYTDYGLARKREKEIKGWRREKKMTLVRSKLPVL